MHCSIRSNPAAIGLGLLLIWLVAAGCSTQTALIATPTLDLQPAAAEAFDHIPPALRTADIPMLYVADRAVEKDTIFGPKYGHGRAGKLVFGTAIVGIEPELTWQQLVAASTSQTRRTGYRLETKALAEYGQLAIPIKELEVRDGRYRLSEEHITLLAESRKRLYAILRERLDASPRKDVYIFVHGFNNSFDDAIYRMAQVWHFMGRVGVPITYTWPAGRGGLTGYAYDRESGEYTVFHLKIMLQAIAECPEVERIHIIAHSRGTDVAITALRELHIAYKARGESTQEHLKLENVVLAAPDLDAQVFEQRFAIEDLHTAANQTTIYFSKADPALSFSNWLFGGRNRLGNLTADKLDDDAKSKLEALQGFTMIDCKVSGYTTGHDYAFVHPAVLSDLILLLRDCKLPGAQHGRPLKAPWGGIWEIDNDYLVGEN